MELWQERVAKDRWDTNAWRQLVAQTAGADVETQRATYERLLRTFPTAGQYWTTLAEMEMAHARWDDVHALFASVLPASVHLPLWRLYLTYTVHLVNQQPDAKQVMTTAYEYVLANVGCDLEAGDIWIAYIDFVSQWTATTPFEEGQRMDTIRKIYHRALLIPLANIEQIWKNYDQFENNLNKITAKKLVAEKSPGYMTARAAVRDLKNLLEPCARLTLPTPPTWSAKDYQQLRSWLALIQWELSNPLHLDVPSPLLHQRITYTFKLCLSSMRFFPDLWRLASDTLLAYASLSATTTTTLSTYSSDEDVSLRKILAASSVTVTSETISDTMTFLKRGREAVPESLVLAFYEAELYERQATSEGVVKGKEVYEDLIKGLEEQYSQMMGEVVKKKEEVEKERGVRHKVRVENAGSEEDNDDDDDEEAEEGADEANGVEAKEISALEEDLKKLEGDVDRIARKAALVWIQYMRFARRTEVNDILWEKLALMEYHCSKDAQVAFKIFEVGLKMFANEPEYISAYVNHLITVNDDNNVRSLLEKSLNTLPPEKCQGLWAQFFEYESQYGDLNSVLTLERRRHEFFQDADGVDDESARFIQRCSFPLLTCLHDEIGLTSQQADTGVSAQPESATTKKPVQRVQLATSREEELMMTYHKPLTSVNKKKYPRINTSSLQPYRVNHEDLLKEVTPKPVFTPRSSSSPMKRPSSPSLTASSTQSYGSRHQRPPPSQPQPTMTQPPHLVPPQDPLSVLLSRLPPTPSYMGPRINPDAILGLLMSVNVPSVSQTSGTGYRSAGGSQQGYGEKRGQGYGQSRGRSEKRRRR